MPGLFAALSLFMRDMVLFVSYIKNNAFPHPLPEQEENRYLELMARGDKNARNLLIEHTYASSPYILKTL